MWENAKALENICFSREMSTTFFAGPNTYKIRDYMRAARAYYPGWDEEYAQKLVAEFGLMVKKQISKLSKGMLSMVTIVLALAAGPGDHSGRAGGGSGRGGPAAVLRPAAGGF